MAYYTDINNYVVVRSSTIEDFGATAGGSAATNFTAVQNAINSDYRVLFFGKGSANEFQIEQPGILKSYKTYINRNVIKIQDGYVVNVTADISIGDSTFMVDNPNLLKVGQWVSVSDNNQLFLYQTYRGWSGAITNIVGNVIYMDGVAPYAYSVTAMARCGHTQGVLYAPEKTNIKIDGDGTFDGNRFNQSQFHPVYGVGIAEDQRATSTVSIWKCSNITINNIHVTKGILHSLTITSDTPSAKSTNIVVNGVSATFGHDKSFLLRNSDTVTLTDIICEDATWEDGLMCYSGCTNVTINGGNFNRNKRYGIGWNSTNNSGLVASDLVTRDNYEHGLSIAADDVVINGCDSNDPVMLTGAYNADNIVINDLVVDGADEFDHINGRGIIYISDNIQDVNLNRCIIRNCIGTGIKAVNIGADFPLNINFVDGGIYNHTGTKTSIAVGCDVSFTNFDM